MASNAIDYPIYLIDKGGQLNAKLDGTDGRAICLTKLADIVRTILRTDVVESALIQMATEFCEYAPTAWFLQEGEETKDQKIKDVVRKFLDMFVGRRGFPTLCPSDCLMHEDITGVSYRYEPQGPFLLPSERIVLNGVVCRNSTIFRCSLAS